LHCFIPVPALTLIAEYAYFLWDQGGGDESVARAVDVYMKSANCATVKKAVDEAFKANGISQNKSGTCQIPSNLIQELVQIALTNRLSMSYFLSLYI